jgi:hypothetical protein
MNAIPPLLAPQVRPELAPVDDVRPAEPVVVHIRCDMREELIVRIWRSTFLLDRDSSHASALVSWEAITVYPEWTLLRKNVPHVFTLVFDPLPPRVRWFDLAEIIPEPQGWYFPGIARRAPDIYYLDLPN